MKSKLRGVGGCRRGRSRQRTAASRGRLNRMNSRDDSRAEAKLPLQLPRGTERSPPTTGRSRPTTGVVPPSQEMDKESAELTMTDIVLGIDDIDDNSNDDGEDDDAVAAQHWLSRDRRHFRSQDRYHHS